MIFRLHFFVMITSNVNIFFSEMSNAEDHRDVFKLTRDWLSVQEVVDAVGSSSCGAISVFIGSYFIDQ